MKLATTTLAASRKSCDCIIVGVYKKGLKDTGAVDIDEASDGYLKKLIANGDINGKAGTSIMLTSVPGIRAKRVLVVGLGENKGLTAKQLRQALKLATKLIKAAKIRNVVSYLGLEQSSQINPYYRARHTVETICDALYLFNETKSSRGPSTPALKKIEIAIDSRGEATKAISGAQHGFAIAKGVSLAKDLGNLPPNICTPSYLARTAQKIAGRYPNVSARVLNEVEIKRLGMRSFLSVTAGTKLPAKLIIMQYKGANKDKPLVLIGKGITFDAGGISLKPGLAMDEMKFDMCGAASVIGTMAVIASLQLPINVNIVVPACENLPSGTATRPGDIIKSMSGQTIEILNTDAEGRLILCDAITYSRRFKPDVVIDVATLTGACVVALGKHRTGIMSYNDNLAQEIHDAGVSANDQGWRLPLGEDYEEQLKSNFADFANIGGRDAGASTAGCFLGKFAEGLNWAHLDIAGIAYRSGTAKGSTGRPVPMLSEFLLRRAGKIL